MKDARDSTRPWCPARGSRTVVLTLMLILTAPWPAPAMTYQPPPSPLGDIVEASLTPAVVVSPDSCWMVLIERPSILELADVSAPELRLGGRR